MRLVKATAADSERLTKFFHNTILPGPIDLQIERVGEFFGQYRIQSDDHVTYILETEKGEIETIASLIFREGWIHGERQTIGYATDLRVSASRRAVIQWAQHFLPVLEQERSQRNCKYVFSIVAQGQRQAYNAFIRPRTSRRTMPRYYLFRRFKIVSLHGVFPFSPKPLDTIITRWATEDDLDSLAAYIVEKKKKQPLHFCHNPEQFIQELHRWPDLKIENFLVALDYANRVIGCVAPWSSSSVQRIYANDFSPKAKTLQETLQAFSWLGLGRRLPKKSELLQFKYLTHLYADNPDIFYSLLRRIYDETPKYEFLVYPHFENDLLTTPPRAFIAGSIPCGLYCILSPSEALPDLLKPTPHQEPPDFELPFF